MKTCFPTALLCLLMTSGLLDAAKHRGADRFSIQRDTFGRTQDGRPVHRYTLANASGMSIAVMNYGATLIAVNVPDKNGKTENVTLYLDSFDDYAGGHPLFGSVVGRFANRIVEGRFTIDGTTHQLETVRNGIHIHGGREGFQKLLWNVEPFHEADSAGIRLTHTSPDGHEGYPGELRVTVIYRLGADNALSIEYRAATDKPTHLNLTNHAYWNLGGAQSGDVLDQRLTLNADRYLPSDKRRVPTGEIASVKSTPFDFTEPHTIGERIEATQGGYDHCYVINREQPGKLVLCAKASDPESGRKMEVWTTQPGVQLYTANGLGPRFQANGKPYGKYHGFCLETQHYPDSPNQPGFPSTLLRPGETFAHKTVHKFSW